MKERTYLCIDLKSFYASVECMERGLDPMQTNLVVADESRTEKTIVLAVSPSLKNFGLPGRPRLFEVVQRIREVNRLRQKNAPNHRLLGSSFDFMELNQNPALAVDYIVAPPRMAFYMAYSTRIYNVYLKYIAPEDIHVYSIDEVFMDITQYMKTYQMTAHELAMTIINDVLKTTGITATAGIGTNLYLAKIAMDVMAKKMKPDKNGVRIAFLDEMTYRQELWNHRPLTDFWRVGKGYAKRLQGIDLYTMGDVARCSLNPMGEEKLYRLFGVNAELLIDHAWGYEPCTIADIKAYKPMNKSLCSGQVLSEPYDFEKTKLVVREMTEFLALDLLEKRLVTDQLVLTVGYDIENLTNQSISYSGEVTTDNYGRKIPKHAHGTENLSAHTSSALLLTKAAMALCDRIMNPNLLVRRIQLSACRLMPENGVKEQAFTEQLDFFTDYSARSLEEEREKNDLQRERKLQEAVIELKHKYGKNAVLKGTNLQEGATARDRNRQIGGHKA